MAADVKVREIRLLEAYSQRYQGFMESSIAMSYRFRAIITQKDDEARDFTRKISDHVNIIEQKLTHAKNDLEASARRGGGMDGKELELRAQKVERWKKLFEKAKQYEGIYRLGRTQLQDAVPMKASRSFEAYSTKAPCQRRFHA